MNNLSFEMLPQAVADLQKSMNEIKQLLQRESTPPQPESETLLTVDEAANFLSLSKSTIYGMIGSNSLPYIKRSKRVYFSSVELMDYMKSGRKKTTSEIGKETDNFLGSKKKGGKSL